MDAAFAGIPGVKVGEIGGDDPKFQRIMAVAEAIQAVIELLCDKGFTTGEVFNGLMMFAAHSAQANDMADEMATVMDRYSAMLRTGQPMIVSAEGRA